MASNPRVLVVDDEPNVRLMFRTALETGYQVDEVSDGAAALDFLATTSPDVVILDLLMPGMGGMEVLRHLREAGNDVPVVIVTAHGSIPDAVAAMKLGAIDFLSKPLTPDRLRNVVAEVVERHATPTVVASFPLRETTTVVTITRPVLDLAPVKLAINRRDFARAANLLEAALDAHPTSAEAHTLMGILQEAGGQNHAAFHSYRTALQSDPGCVPALENLERYCREFGLDFHNPNINPVAGKTASEHSWATSSRSKS